MIATNVVECRFVSHKRHRFWSFQYFPSSYPPWQCCI